MCELWMDEQLQDSEHEHSEEQLVSWTRALWKSPAERDRKILAFELLKLRKQFVSDRVVLRKLMIIKENLANAMRNAFAGEIHDNRRPKHY